MSAMKPCEVCGLPSRQDHRRSDHICGLCRRIRFTDSDALTGGEWINDKGVMRWKAWLPRKRGAA